MVKEAHRGKTLTEIADLYGVGRYDTHLFLCTGPDCCTPEDGDRAWQQVKVKIKSLFPNLADSTIYRTKVGCLRMCQEGPIAVCYPQGKWFRGVTAENVDSVIEHIVSGHPGPHALEFAENPLPRVGEQPEIPDLPHQPPLRPR